MKKTLLGLAFLLMVPSVFAEGHGRDGGWPQSIQLLRIAKQNLLELIDQATDKDVQDAINGMHDREAFLKPEEVNASKLGYLVSRVQEQDVLEIEKSTYTGIKLFDYSGENTLSPIIFATKNFYNSSRYGKPTGEVTVSLIKEVERLILHEVSHLWGFGEETPETNYAEKFAVKMIDILHGAEKISFTQEEKMSSVLEAYDTETHDPIKKNELFKFDGKKLNCLHIDTTTTTSLIFTFGSEDFNDLSSNGLVKKDDERSKTIGRVTSDDYLIFKTNQWNGRLRAFDICHEDLKKFEDIENRFIKSYYSRSNLLTDLDHSSTSTFKSLILNRIESVYISFFDVQEIQLQNQEQIIYNIDVKIKKERAVDFQNLISKKHKFTKKEDSKLVDEFNKIQNDGMMSVGERSSKYRVRIKTIKDEISSMKNYARLNYLDNLFSEYSDEFNKIVDEQNKKFEDLNSDTSSKFVHCGKFNKIGEFYNCQINNSRYISEENKRAIEKSNLAMKQLQARFVSKISNYQD